MQRSLTLTPPPAATLSSLPCKSPYGSLGRMAFFPSFSWSGKCDSRERSESEHQRCVIPANSRAEEGLMREFPGFSRFGTNRPGLLASDPPLPLRTSQLYNRPSCRRAWLVLCPALACGKSLLCCERPWSSLWHHLSICFMAFPISASIQIERRRISAGAPVSPRLMHAYTAFRFCAVIFQKGYLIITGVLPPTPSSR